MGFSKNIKKYFADRKMNIRQISEKMEGYNTSLIGRYMADDKISGTFITKLNYYFPEININEMMQDDLLILSEPSEVYKTRKVELIEEIEERLTELKKIVSR